MFAGYCMVLQCVFFLWRSFTGGHKKENIVGYVKDSDQTFLVMCVRVLTLFPHDLSPETSLQTQCEPHGASRSDITLQWSTGHHEESTPLHCFKWFSELQEIG